MRRQELVQSLMRLGLTRSQAGTGVDGFFTTVTAALREGKKVSIVGFGTWEWRKRPPRIARNPRSGKKVALGPRKVLIFRPSPKLKKKLNP